MNWALPPGDCGSQSSAVGWTPGHQGFVPGPVGLVLGIAFFVGCPRVGTSFAPGGPRSRWESLRAVFHQGGNARPDAPGVGDGGRRACRGRNRAREGGRRC
jgi:hypothetical protein